MNYTEDDLIPISALQHVLYCERQCALIHIEQVWSENRLTVEGKQLHERVDEGGHVSRKDIRYEYRVPLVSYRLGLIGYADMVEFHRPEGDQSGLWQPYPVEYKHGEPKTNDIDMVQLCAQALCLEEMLDASIDEGALFYGSVKRRTIVALDQHLRERTTFAANRVHELLAAGIVPFEEYADKCRNCSLQETCLPQKKTSRKIASNYVKKIYTALEADETRS